MERLQIESFKMYCELTRGVRLYNNGFSPDEVKKYISEGRLYKIAHDSAFVFLYDEKEYVQLVIPIENNLDNLKMILSELNNVPVVCYVIQDGKMLAEQFENLLKLLSFELNTIIYEYLLDEMPQEKFATKEEVKNHIEFSYQYQNIIDLWKRNLPCLELPYLSKEDICVLEKKGQLLYIEDEMHGIKAACCIDNFLGKGTVQHIVVDEKWRGCGLATDLLHTCLNKSEENRIRKARSWIESGNIASQKSFEKVGFERTGIISYQYVYSCKN